MEKKCQNCGADFDANLPECPYCGALNYSGAEKQYLGKLDDLKEDLEQMGNDSLEEYAHAMKKSTVIIITTISVLILLTGILLALFFYADKKFNDQYSNADLSRAMMVWRNENYPIMDEMYEAGDYQGIYEFQQAHSDDVGYSTYNWAHEDFIVVYTNYVHFKEWESTSDASLDDLKWALYDATNVDIALSSDYYTFTEEEKTLIQGWMAETRAFYQETLHLDDAEIDGMYDKLTDPGKGDVITSALCKEFLESKGF